MKICFIADARSPIARGWIELFRGRHEIIVLSTFPVDPAWDGVRLINLQWMNRVFKPGLKNKIEKTRGRGALRLFYDVVVQPIRAKALSPQVRQIVAELKPDVVHALRISIEAQTAVLAACKPLAVSIWGEADFELHAKRSFLNRYLTRMTIRRADAVIADCALDFSRAKEFGLADHHLTATLPGGGGLDCAVSCNDANDIRAEFGISQDATVVLTPRGARYYVRNDTFLKATKIVRDLLPSVVFLGVGLKGWMPAEEFVKANSMESTLKLLPYVTQVQLFKLMRTATLSLSLSQHDGTPNTLLEAMRHGCFPICGDLPSIREWITSGRNGYLVDSSNPQQVADRILEAIRNRELRKSAAEINLQLVQSRADRLLTLEKAENLYQSLALRK